MKNIHVLPTDKPSRLIINTSGVLTLGKEVYTILENKQNIYITSDEEIKEGDWFILDMSHSSHSNELHQLGDDKWSKTGGIHFCEGNSWVDSCKKIILTTDQDLIKDGVQPIDDEFLEWFVKNPSCEFAHLGFTSIIGDLETKRTYKIIIPKEEPKQEFLKQKRMSGTKTVSRILEESKQETLEEAAENYAEGKSSSSVFQEAHKRDFINGVKWQQERSYSEEEIYNLIQAGYSFCEKGKNREDVKKWFEQFKKK